MRLDLDELLTAPLPPGTKGLPIVPKGFCVADIKKQNWQILNGDLPMPVAVIKSQALNNNITVLNDYLAAVDIKLAPHGKTTLCPQLFERQLQGGAWGITVATISQLALCHHIGVDNILMANELVGSAEIAQLAALSAQKPLNHYYVLVDSLSAAMAIQDGFAACPDAPRAKVLIEVGMKGGRCGVRTSDEVVALAQYMAKLDRVELCGIEGYEGLIIGPDAHEDAKWVNDYLQTLMDSFYRLKALHLFANPDQIILSAGGSVYYDLVARLFSQQEAGSIVPIVRSGCYLTHDSGFYRRMLAQVHERHIFDTQPQLLPALEVWTRVLSRPEPDLVILSAGKRDLSYDIDLPEPISWYRQGEHEVPQSLSGCHISKLSDQHAFMHLAPDSPLAVGDLVALGISHPCTTFDKWSLMYEVDEDYRVLGGLKTYF